MPAAKSVPQSDPLVALHESSAETLPPMDVLLAASDTFPRRHVGPNADEIREMLGVLGLDSLDELIDQTVPVDIRLNRPLKLEGLDDRPRGEEETLAWLREIAKKNVVKRSLIGMGYAGTGSHGAHQDSIGTDGGRGDGVHRRSDRAERDGRAGEWAEDGAGRHWRAGR